ncbi:MAG: SH3 domain-containing protein [Pseudomonadota bacterium]
MKRTATFTAALAVLAGLAAVPSASNASAFVAWEVTGVAWNDTLNIRRWPASHSQKRAAVPNGTVLQMTGKCKDAPHLLHQISGMHPTTQRQVVRYKWCEIYHSPANNGAFEPGWIYMKYAKPFGS